MRAGLTSEMAQSGQGGGFDAARLGPLDWTHVFQFRVAKMRKIVGMFGGVTDRAAGAARGGLGFLAMVALLAGAASLPARAATFPLPTDGSSVVGHLFVVTANKADTLLDIARHYDIGSDEIHQSNPGVDIWLPKQGERVLIPLEFVLPPKPWRGIVADVSARRIYYFPRPKPGQPAEVITFPIGVSRDKWPTPTGITRVVAKVRNPSWIVPKSILAEHAAEGDPLPKIVPPGPDNPMGLMAIRTAIPGIFIHGTSRPWGVGSRVSHGCMHLYPEDVASIFDSLPIGTPVRIINEPYQVGERGGVLYLAAHQPLSDYPAPAAPEQWAVDAVTKALAGRQILIDWARVKRIVQEHTTVPTPISLGTPPLTAIVARLPATPYLYPPYGTDANDATVPPPQLPLSATTAEAAPAAPPVTAR